MDILNFISWIKGSKLVPTVDPQKTLIPLGVKTNTRDDDYVSVTMTVQNFATQVAATIPAGAQGPMGPQGVPGPVGPAGLNWQGAWSAAGTYVVDDAVGFGGASWFCIANVGPGGANPPADPTSWALLASQGATGPQGPQGIQGPIGPSGTATPSFSKVPSGLVVVAPGSNITVTFSTIPANTYNNSSWPIFAINTALQKLAAATTLKTKVYITNTAPNQGSIFNAVGATLIADTDTATSGVNQRVVKIEKDIWFTNNACQFLNNGTNPNVGFSDSAIGSNAGATYNSGIFENAMTAGFINWSLNTYIVVTVESVGGTSSIAARYLSVARI
jgi:hypothetical protein